MGTAKEFDLEGCTALEPDLVILPMKLKDAAATLEELGINVLLVNPEDQPQLEDMISLIAEATNTQAQAEKLLKFMDDQETMLTEKLADAGYTQRLSRRQLRDALHRRRCHVSGGYDPAGWRRQCGL